MFFLLTNLIIIGWAFLDATDGGEFSVRDFFIALILWCTYCALSFGVYVFLGTIYS